MTPTIPEPPQMEPSVPESNLRWYQGVPRYAWTVLIIAALGWLFDTMDQHIFNLLRQASVKEILTSQGVPDAQLNATATAVGAQVTAWFLIGWATGGIIFGILGDRLGRTRTMVITICIYAAFTGLNGLVQTIWQYELCRFLTALGVGGEFAAGAALVAEVFPERSRAMALGTLQSLSAVGNIAASLLTLAMSAVSWRWAFAVGVLPALLVVFIRTVVKEPERWQQARQTAVETGGRKELGNIFDLFRDPMLRRNTLVGIMLAVAGVGGFWGVSVWLPDLIGSALSSLPVLEGMSEAAKKSTLQQYRSTVSLVQQVGAFFGMFSFALLCVRIGRRPALLIFFLLAFGAIQGTFRFVHTFADAMFWAPILGFCATAPFAAFCVYFPELFPTRLRATGVGLCYNVARYLAAAAPIALGGLAAQFDNPLDKSAGLRVAASIVACIYAVGLVALAFAPETKGKPLPE